MEAQDIDSGKLHKTQTIPGLLTTLTRLFRMVHTGYGLFVFGALFLLALPWLLMPMVNPRWHALTGIVNRWWARLMFIFVGLPFNVVYRFKPDRRRQYIFCPNHFSYIDIPTMGLNRFNTLFVGKSAIEKVPLFGYMYKRLHITVDRASMKSRYQALLRSRQAIDEGKNLVIYPEGGILSPEPPQLAAFKDGAFRLAIEKQIPVVPVTIPYNWIILPDQGFLLHWHPVKVIFHEPVETRGLTLADLDDLKQKVRTTINNELLVHRKNKYED